MISLILAIVAIIIGLDIFFSLALTGLPVASVFYFVKANSQKTTTIQNYFVRRRTKI
jgi:hypothetical protein